jgi:YegS/Rv2252/BmrU family lipid kinase
MTRWLTPETIDGRAHADRHRSSPASVDPAPARPGILVVWNPTAGGGSDDDRDARRDAIERALRGHGVDAELYESPSEEAAARRVDEALEAGVERIVAAGGDHTVRSIAFKLLGRETALGVLPMGTAMNIARSLGIPLDLDGAAAILASGSVRAIDVGYVGERPFLEVATVGLAAELLADATRASEGRLRSALDLLTRAIRHRRTRVWLDLDGREVRHRVVSLSIANGPFTGRALEAAPGARVDDGLLDVVCYLGYGPFQVIKELARALTGIGSGTSTVTYRARRVRIRSHHPLPIRADSEDVGTTPIVLDARRVSLRVIAPARRVT